MMTAIDAVIIVLIKSPIPTMTHLLSVKVDAPDPTAPVTAVCNCVNLNCPAINTCQNWNRILNSLCYKGYFRKYIVILT